MATVWGHRFGAVSVMYEAVDPRSLNSVINLVATGRFASAQALLHLFVAAGIAPYQPVLLSSPDGGTLLLGPLVERHPKGLLILDGVHRSLAALRHGLSTVWAAILTTQRRPEPAGPLVPLSAVTPSTAPQTWIPLFRHTDNDNFRPTQRILEQAQSRLELDLRLLAKEDHMAHADHSWDKDANLNDERLGADVVPTRYALTAPQVVVNDDKQILIVDPHPAGTWDTWMFPYASLIVTREEVSQDSAGQDTGSSPILAIAEGSTFRELSEALGALRRERQDEYVSAIQTGVNNVIADLNGTWSGAGFYTNYSLKFSKTSGSYTAYEFNYFLNRVAALRLDIPHVWIEPERLAAELEGSETPFGRKVSSNVADALPAIHSAL
ncbi:hypothetical protein [Streptomyces sp. NL15-2K]|uniref:hypothetical protein n=1 Tax=Streptomyces sp. NL15-2K TaxID=376149 RepID=UPI000F564585|nr:MULTISPECIES: hypothetical protein [Actinomycetes]WKX09452.1 hypothetical protein Q4V64_18950 [Kutzneria buriramensis]GCB49039.1 hypothetical protein SNL152K_6369 [Streptomyces sp. NL15-2K]